MKRKHLYAVFVNGEKWLGQMDRWQAYYIAFHLRIIGCRSTYGKHVRVEKDGYFSNDYWSVYVGRVESVCMIPKWRAKLIVFALHLCGVDNARVVHF